MKWYLLVVTGLLSVALLGGAVGCNKGGEKKTVVGKSGEKLSVKGPADTTVKPGETAVIVVEITREKFNDPVSLVVVGLPEGVSIMEDDMTISKDKNSAKLTLKATPEAKAVQDQKVTVTASSGELKQDVAFKVSVKKPGDTEKKLTLKAPSDASVKQGDTTPITIDITRDKFNDPVSLKFSGLPEGVSVMEKDLAISKDASSAKLTLKAADDAKAVDDQNVTVTATGGGLTQEATFKLSVKKKS